MEILYLIEGSFGLPVFAKGGGIGYLLGPTGGYLIGFIFTAFFNVILIPLTLKIIPNTEKIDVLQINDFNDRYQNSILKI